MSDISEYGVHTKAELLFPAHLIPSLRDLRGEEWRSLVDRVAALAETHPDSLAFVLMMIELDGCLKCNSNNYKFLRGCYLCATQTIQSYKGSDQDLLALYNKAKQELSTHLQQGVRGPRRDEPGRLARIELEPGCTARRRAVMASTSAAYCAANLAIWARERRPSFSWAWRR